MIAPSAESRRAWTRILCAIAMDLPVLAWKLADTHLHVLVSGDLETALDRLQEAGAIHDSLGLRRIGPAPALRVREHLPRLTRDDLLKLLGVPSLEVEVRAEHLAAATDPRTPASSSG